MITVVPVFCGLGCGLVEDMVVVVVVVMVVIWLCLKPRLLTQRKMAGFGSRFYEIAVKSKI